MSTELKVYRRSELESIKPQIDAAGCLWRYDQIWNKGVKDDSDVSLIGIGYHAVKHAYIEELLAAKVSQDAELAQQAFVAGIAQAQTPTRLIPDVQDLWHWHAESFELDLDRFVAAEERGSVGDVGFTPDLVLAHPESNTLEIIDDKSGWNPPMSEAALKGLFQARCYSRYAQDRWPGFSGYKFTLNAIRFRKSVSVVFTPSELDAVEQEIRAAISIIEHAKEIDSWPATAGPSCHFCNLDCPLVREVATLPIRMSHEDFPKLAAWTLVADKQLKAAKKLLKAGVGMYGPITVNGVCWENRPSESKAYPIQSLMEVLEFRGGMGAFEDKSLTISHSALKKLFKLYPGLESDLSGVVQSKVVYRFGPAKPALGPAGEEDDE